MENPNSVTKGREIKLPIGFRFHPTDEELLLHYLKRKVHSFPLPASLIPQLDVFHTNPWDLPGDSREKRYFFCRIKRNENKCSRITGSGYWKSVGKDEYIVASGSNRTAVGVKRTLIFCRGKRPGGLRTQWEMHEYRLLGSETTPNTTQKFMMEVEEWVVCRIHQKRRKSTKSGAKTDLSDGNKKIRASVIDIMMEDSSESGPPQPSSSCSGVITTDADGVSSKGSDQEETSSAYNIGFSSYLLV